MGPTDDRDRTVLTVRGTAREEHAPQLAVVELAVRDDGPDPVRVRQSVAAAVRDVESSLRAHAVEAGGAVTTWSSDTLRTSVERHRLEDDGRLRHVASVGFRVTLAHPPGPGAWLGEVLGLAAVGVERVWWRLDPVLHTERVRAVRAAAVRDARARARDLAAAAGLGEPVPVQLAEAGLLEPGLHPHDPGDADLDPFLSVGGRAAGGVDAPELAPRPVVVAAAVDARFAAGPG